MSELLLHSEQARVVWGEIAPCQQFAHFYQDNDALLDTLTRFVGAGLRADETTIVIATPEHLRTLRKRLTLMGVDLDRSVCEDRFVTIDAATGLNSFMVEGLPDEGLFHSFVDALLRRVVYNGPRIRMISEMIALLWAAGLAQATARAELLWHQYCEKHSHSLFCAYPRAKSIKDAPDVSSVTP